LKGLEDGEALIHIKVTCRRVSSHCARQVFPSGGFAQRAPSQLEAGLLKSGSFFALKAVVSGQRRLSKFNRFDAIVAVAALLQRKIAAGGLKMAKKRRKTETSQRFLQGSHANLSLHLFAMRNYMRRVTRTNDMSR